MDKTDNLHVVIRVRPLISTEKSSNSAVQWQVSDNTIFQLDSDGQRKPPIYTFDRVFDSSCTSVNVFDEVARPILDATLEGYNGTIFAYGQTSSGKTHTMMGSEKDFGVIPRMAKALFQAIENSPSRKFLLRASYMEIYNEKVFDLLSECRQMLNVREDLAGQTFVENLTEEFINNQKDLLKIMKKGEIYRSYGSTNANEKSSRSHTIFRMIIESASLPADSEDDCTALNQEDEEAIVMVSHLNLVDLAGSERAGQSGTTGNRLREGCAINTSLFTLRNVISKLSQSDSQFINFRDSKLTRILQPSLGGNAKTSIICTVTPAMIEETHSTLKFASTAKTIKNKPVINEVLSEEALLKRYTKDIQQLKNQIQNNLHKDQEMKQIKLELQETSEKNQKLEQQLKLLQENIVTSSLRSPHSGLPNPNPRRLTWGGPRLPSVSSPAMASFPMPWDRENSTSVGDVILKSVHFEKRISNEKARLSQDAECQVNISDSAAQERSNEDKKALEEKVKLTFKILELQKELQCEKAKGSSKADESLMFLKEENSVQADDLKNLTSENEMLKQKIVLLEKELVKLSQTIHTQKTSVMDSHHEMQKQLSTAELRVKKLTDELKDSEIKLEHHLKQSELLKSELRNELQSAYNYIERLEKYRAQPEILGIGAVIKENLDKSIHALALDEVDDISSKFMKPWLDSHARKGACGVDFDSEMQIVQMEFEQRESALVEEIATKNSRIKDLENQVNKLVDERVESLNEIEDLKSAIAKTEENLKSLHLEDIAAREAQLEMFKSQLNGFDKERADLLKRFEDMTETIEANKENEQRLTHELDKARFNCQEMKSSCDLAAKEYEVKLSAMEQKIAELESISNNQKTGEVLRISDSQNSSATESSTGPLDIPDMRKKIDDMQCMVEEFCLKEKMYIDQLENLKKDHLGFDFQNHFRESREYQEDMRGKIEDLRSMVVLYKQKEQHILEELESVKAELLHHQSLSLTIELKRNTGDVEGHFIAAQEEKILALREMIRENRRKEEHLVEKLENLKSEVRQRHVSLLSIDAHHLKDTVGELIEIEKNVKQLEAEIMNYKQKEEELSIELHSLRCNSCSATQDNSQLEKLEQAAIQLENCDTILPNDERDADCKYSEMKDKLVDNETTISRYIEKEARLVEEVNGLRERLLEKSRELDLNLQLKENLVAELEELRQKERDRENGPNLSDEIASAEAELRATKAEVQLSEIRMQLEELQNLVLQYECKEKQLLSDSQNLNADLQRYRDLVSEKEVKIALLETKLSELESENEKLAESILQRAHKEESYLEELEKVKNDLNELQIKEAELSLLLAEHADCAQREKKLRQYVQNLESDVQTRSEANFNKRELFGQLESGRNNEKRLKESLKEKEVELMESQQQVSQYEEKMDILKQQLYEHKNELDVLQSYLVEMQERETELVGKLELKTKENENLQGGFEQAKKELINEYKALNVDYQDLQTELEEIKDRFHEMQRKQPASGKDGTGVFSPICQQGVAVGIQCQIKENVRLNLPILVSTSTQCEALPLADTKRHTKDVSCGTFEPIQKRTIKFTKGIQCELLTIECPNARETKDNMKPPTVMNAPTASCENAKVSTSRSIHDSQSMMTIIWKDSEEIENRILSADGTLTEDQMLVLSEIQTLKEDFTKLRKSHSMLKLLYGSTLSDNERYVNLAKGVQNHGKILEQELEMTRTELEVTKAELNGKVTRERGNNSARKNVLEQAQVENVEKLRKLNEAYSTLKKKFDFLQQENTSLMSEIKALQETSYENSESRRNAVKMVSSLQAQVQNANERCERLQKEIRRLSSLQNTTIFPDAQKSRTKSENSDSGVCSQVMEMYGGGYGRGSVTVFALESVKAEKAQLERKYQELKRRSSEQKVVIQEYVVKFGNLKPESPIKREDSPVKITSIDSSPSKTTLLNSPVKSETRYAINAPVQPLTESGQLTLLPSNTEVLDKPSNDFPIDNDVSFHSWINNNENCKVS